MIYNLMPVLLRYRFDLNFVLMAIQLVTYFSLKLFFTILRYYIQSFFFFFYWNHLNKVLNLDQFMLHNWNWIIQIHFWLLSVELFLILNLNLCWHHLWKNYSFFISCVQFFIFQIFMVILLILFGYVSFKLMFMDDFNSFLHELCYFSKYFLKFELHRYYLTQDQNMLLSVLNYSS